MPRVVHFADFEANLDTGELRKLGRRIRLSPQPFQILALLLEKPGELVTREEIRARLWPGEVYVDFDHSLNSAVKKLREALCDSPENPRYIETFPKRGYRLMAKVEAPERLPQETALQSATNSQLADTSLEPPTESLPALPFATAAPSPGGRRMILYALAVIAIVAVFWIAFRASGSKVPERSASNARTMLAVLPFENLTGEAGQEYLSDGITEELITELSVLQPDRLGVIARTSVMGYKHTSKRVDAIGRDLGVGYVLEGSLRQSGDRVRITAQVIRVSDQAHVWAQEFDSDSRDVLIMEADVARKIAAETQVRLSGPPIANPAPVNPEAYALYLKGRYCWNQRTNQGLHQSIEYFEQAIDKDPHDARSYAGLADSYVLLATYGDVPPIEADSKARIAAKKALELNPNLSEAHTSLALIGPDHPWDWTGSQREFLRAIALNPNYATAHHWYGDGYLSPMGRLDEALAEVRLAEKLDPLSPIIATDVAKELFYARKYSEAEAQLKKVLELSPNYPTALEWLRDLQIIEKKYDAAMATLELEKQTLPPARYVIEKAIILGASGQSRPAREYLSRALRMEQTQYVNPGDIAFAYLVLGDKDNCFLWFEKAYQGQSPWMTGLNVDPALDPIRSEPRFKELVKRVGLPP